MAEKEQKECPYDGSPFTPTRRNQIYASRANQIAHKNEKARIEKEQTKLVDNALKKNRKICMELLTGATEAKTFNIEFLNGKGFHLNSCSGSFKSREKHYTSLYEFYILKVDEQIIIGKTEWIISNF